MNTNFRNFLMGAGLTAMLWAPLLKAEDNLAVAKIPFDFQINKTSFPAGTYSVIMNVSTIQLRNESTGKSVMLMPPGRETNNSPEAKLTFRHYSDQDHYFLSGIYTYGNPGYTLTKGSLERELERSKVAVAMTYVAIASR
jgi:hypothetical protein